MIDKKIVRSVIFYESYWGLKKISNRIFIAGILLCSIYLLESSNVKSSVFLFSLFLVGMIFSQSTIISNVNPNIQGNNFSWNYLFSISKDKTNFLVGCHLAGLVLFFPFCFLILLFSYEQYSFLLFVISLLLCVQFKSLSILANINFSRKKIFLKIPFKKKAYFLISNTAKSIILTFFFLGVFLFCCELSKISERWMLFYLCILFFISNIFTFVWVYKIWNRPYLSKSLAKSFFGLDFPIILFTSLFSFAIFYFVF